ncbi:hypothetical protein PAMA_018495 [Pampus argenteus]
MFGEKLKNFNISFTALNERSTFTSGDVITGNISFDLTKETKITAITMSLTGKAEVSWSTNSAGGGGGGGRRGGGGGRRRRRSSTRRHYSAKLEFFNLNTTIMQENSATGDTTKLPPGTHTYPFACQLPQGDFPSAFHGVHGNIVYALTVSINMPWHLSKDFVTELNFVKRINTNVPELQAPLSGTNSQTLCCLWCSSVITMTAHLEKKAYVPGETVRIICVFDNGSSRTATPKVKLQQKQVVHTHNKAHHKTALKNLLFLTGDPVSAHTSDVHTDIMLTIPYLTPLTVSNCRILEVNYIIELSLCVRGSFDLTVLFPIILCDTPVVSHAQIYQ